MEDEKKTIRIDADLYESVREYCDRENIALVDFVEDSLENAISFHAQLSLLEENKKLLAKIKEKYQTIRRAGFNEGFFVAFYAIGGDIWAAMRNKTLRFKPKKVIEPVEARQLSLFKE